MHMWRACVTLLDGLIVFMQNTRTRRPLLVGCTRSVNTLKRCWNCDEISISCYDTSMPLFPLVQETVSLTINPCLHQSEYTITSSKENTKIIVDPLQLFQRVCLVIYSLTSHFKGVGRHLYLKGALKSFGGVEGYSLFGAIYWSR